MVKRQTKRKALHSNNKTKKISKIDKKCVSDDEMGQICSTGQYSTYQGNFYKNENNLIKFKEIK